MKQVQEHPRSCILHCFPVTPYGAVLHLAKLGICGPIIELCAVRLDTMHPKLKVRMGCSVCKSVSQSILHWLRLLTTSFRSPAGASSLTKRSLFCITCTSTGRTCEGYAPPPPRRPGSCGSKYTVLEWIVSNSPATCSFSVSYRNFS